MGLDTQLCGPRVDQRWLWVGGMNTRWSGMCVCLGDGGAYTPSSHIGVPSKPVSDASYIEVNKRYIPMPTLDVGE